jgi:hypothetical protein
MISHADPRTINPESSPKKLLDQVRAAIRVKHYARNHRTSLHLQDQ